MLLASRAARKARDGQGAIGQFVRPKVNAQRIGCIIFPTGTLAALGLGMPRKAGGRADVSFQDHRALEALSAPKVARLMASWQLHARLEQLPPSEPWSLWVFLGGRGAGKTRAGAEWVRQRIELGAGQRIALLGATHRDVREVMVEGPSGLARISGARFEPGRARLVWPNGAIGYAFSAEQPDRLRGPQFDTAWADEFAAWSYPEALAMLRLGLRLGDAPKLMVSTTPRPIKALKALLAEPGARVTTAAMRRNLVHLAPGFVAQARARWGGAAFGRQELDGELVDDPAGTLWRRAELEAVQISQAPELERIVIGLDPPVSVGPSADACGIVAAGAFIEAGQRKAIVLADASIQGLRPEQWALRAVQLARRMGANAIVAEANQGGELVRSVLQASGAAIPIRLVHAKVSKRDRAAPIQALYAQGRVLHLGSLSALEDEMCAFGAPDFAASPDRLDALVWALSDLLLAKGGDPRIRTL